MTTPDCDRHRKAIITAYHRVAGARGWLTRAQSGDNPGKATEANRRLIQATENLIHTLDADLDSTGDVPPAV